MAFTGQQTAVVVTATGEYLYSGEADNEHDGFFNPAVHELIETDFIFEDDYNYTWNGSTFIKGAAIDRTPGGVLLKDVSTGAHFLVEVDNGALRVIPG